MPKISIIIPVYKVEEYIRECADSILAQDYADYEIILVDDGSPDRCPDICDSFALRDGRVKVIHKKNEGPSAARNTGLLSAEGDYIWFVDSDDYIAENSLKKISEYFEKDPDIIRFNAFSLKGDKKEKMRDIENGYSGEADHKTVCALAETACTKSLFPFGWRNVYKREFLLKNDLKFAGGLSYGEDSVLNSAAYFLAEKIIFIDDFLYVYRLRDDGLSKQIPETFNENSFKGMEIYDSLRDENYEKLCAFPSENYYKDAGRFTIQKIFQYMLLPRVYYCKDKNKFKLFKMIAKSNLMKKAFSRFDINEIKSKSMDWRMFWAVKHKMYLLGHLICKYILYK